MSNDIGLIKLKEKVIFTEFVLPICLPIAESVKNQNTDSMNFIAVGWGVTEHGNGTKGRTLIYSWSEQFKKNVPFSIRQSVQAARWASRYKFDLLQ